MALWDNFTKKASETTAKAIQQAKILSETAKLNSMISDEETKISTAYFQIGKLYHSQHLQDPGEDYAAMFAAIAEAEAKIRDYRTQIQDIKGVCRCEKCGAEVAKGVAFCSSCGAAIPKAEPVVSDTHNICPGCGAQVEKGMRFCTACGTPMTAPAEQAEAPAPEQSAPEKRFCANCGAEIAKDMAFCTECGAKVQ